MVHTYHRWRHNSEQACLLQTFWHLACEVIYPKLTRFLPQVDLEKTWNLKKYIKIFKKILAKIRKTCKYPEFGIKPANFQFPIFYLSCNLLIITAFNLLTYVHNSIFLYFSELLFLCLISLLELVDCLVYSIHEYW